MLLDHAVLAQSPDKFVEGEGFVAQVLGESSLRDVAEKVKLPQPIHTFGEAEAKVGPLLRFGLDHFEALFPSVDLDRLGVVVTFAIRADALQNCAVGDVGFGAERRPVVELFVCLEAEEQGQQQCDPHT